MRIYVEKLTDISLARKACQYTLHNHGKSKIPLRKLYGAEHSPARTQMFWVEMKGIPSYVSVHLTRHKIGVEHFVQTHRTDRGADFIADRNTPVNHAMFINAQALINMSRKRLCTQADPLTRKVWEYVCSAMLNIDSDLHEFMVVDCMYRGQCFEPVCCGRAESYFKLFDDSHSGRTVEEDDDLGWWGKGENG